MTYGQVLKEARERYEKAVGHLQDQMRGVRTGRATPALVENLRMDYYGTPTPLNQLASISIPEPRQIILKPFDASAIKEMAKALMKADLGTAPQEDGKLIRLTLPPLSGEQRNKYVAKVKDMAEETRIAMRNSRRDLNKQADSLFQDGELTEDENRKLHGEIQDLLKEYEKQVDQLLEKKVQEIQEV